MAEARPGSPSNCPIASASASGSLGGTTRPLTSSATISALPPTRVAAIGSRSEEHTSELQSLMRISYAVFCLKKKKIHKTRTHTPKNNLTQPHDNIYTIIQPQETR